MGKAGKMMTEVSQVLKDVYGFDEFRPGQAEVIAQLVAGKSALAVFPTGSGKSLCYELPALLFEGLTLVISPLIALMKDQIDFLQGKGVRAARLDSSLTADEARQVWDDLRGGRLKLLYVAPERFGSERFIQRLRQMPISLMVIDEAHCISEWGHNFRPDYLKLARVAQTVGAERVLALTATATPGVAQDICRTFAIAPEAYVNTGFHRPNLIQWITPCTPSERDALLLARLRQRPAGATIVYVTVQKMAERVAELLQQNGFEARAYHAGMKSEERNAVQDWFMAAEHAVVVATIAFGMGVDKANIRYVYHYNLPKALENYAQEIGRAGRDGREAVCELLVCQEDVVTLENFSYGDTPTPEAVGALVREVLSQGERFDVSVYELSAAHDIRGLVVSTLLCYLELENIIESTGPFYNLYKFRPQKPSGEILARFDAQRAAFLRSLFQQAKKGRSWFSVDLREAAAALSEPRSRLVAALDYLEEKGDLELQVSGVRQGYRMRTFPADLEGLIATLAGRFQASEQRDIGRLRQVLGLAGKRDCVVREMLEYFGEKLDTDCGHCDRCLGEEIPPMPPPHSRQLGEEEAERVRNLQAQRHPALAHPRQMARFLCGLTSPAANRARLGRHADFGCLSTVPFQQVLDLVAQTCETC
jgi:ATP-dependent DNA helicase RecQ